MTSPDLVTWWWYYIYIHIYEPWSKLFKKAYIVDYIEKYARAFSGGC